MIIDKLFGNMFGMIFLVVFMLVVLALIIFMFLKKDNIEDVEEQINDNTHEDIVNEVVEDKENVSSIQEVTVQSSESTSNSEYEIIESEDGFFRVRKVGSERTIRKFSTRKEAVEYVKEKENDWSKNDR